MDARRTPIAGNAALKVLDGADRLIVAKGKKVETVPLGKGRPDDQALLALLLGPTGNLRAPSVRSGKTVIVGFAAESYEAFAERKGK